MEKNLNLSKCDNETILELYKKSQDYIAYLEKEKTLKSTEEK